MVSVASKLQGGGARSCSGDRDRPYYDEYEFERKVRKRRARLVSAAEDAFTHIKRIRKDQLGENVDRFRFLICFQQFVMNLFTFYLVTG